MVYDLQSLITILEEILNPQQTRWILDHNKPQLESLLEKAAYLQRTLDRSSLPKIESLESQIRDAAHNAADIIESHMVDQKLSNPEGVAFSFLTPDLKHVEQELNSATEQVVEFLKVKTMSTRSSSSGASFSPSKRGVFGVEKDLVRLKDRLTGVEKKLEIIPIVGMGGIGKTTLARKLYDDPLIVSHFDFRAWSTISQDYDMKAILLALVSYQNEKDFDQDSEILNLYQSLFGRRYMIVLDDIWSTRFWDDIKRCFRDDNNGSRIVITTRESDVAKYVDSHSPRHEVQLLSKTVSWDLLRQIVFGEEGCSDHILQEIGEKIASDCGGLPLVINVIGGLLSKVERSRDAWENIGNDVGVAIAESDEQFSNILSLSYNHLSNYLKPCFLYMGAFREDYEIKGSKLVRMWVAEGFVKSNGDKSLEEEAEGYLKVLVERNLLMVRRHKSNGKTLSYDMHDLLRDLCVRKAEEEKCLHVVKNVSESEANLRRVIVNIPYGGAEDFYASAEFMPHTRSFLHSGFVYGNILPRVFFALKLLRVLDIENLSFLEFPRDIYNLVNLRYLAIYCHKIPNGISRLWNLQTLIVSGSQSDVPCEIWEISDLRHFELNAIIIFENDDMKKFVLEKLQTLSAVSLNPSLIRNGFFDRIPNIKNLEIHSDSSLLIAVDLHNLHRLERLTCYSQCSTCFLPTVRFPSSLRKLTLNGCKINERASMSLCALPNLEVLKIYACKFESEQGTHIGEWEVREGDVFRSLLFLHLKKSNLKLWRADETNFPILRNLVLEYCHLLEEIPSGIGDIPTLQLIELHNCRASSVASAKQIQEVQQSQYDIYDLQLRIRDTGLAGYEDCFCENQGKGMLFLDVSKRKIKQEWTEYITCKKLPGHSCMEKENSLDSFLSSLSGALREHNTRKRKNIKLHS